MAAVTAWGNRALAAAPIGNQVVWGAMDVDAHVWSGAIDSGARDSVDVAVWQSQAIVAAGRAGQITLWLFDGANGALQTVPSAKLEAAELAGGVELAGYDGSSLSVAAAHQRVLVAYGVLASSGGGPGAYVMLDTQE